MQSPDNRILYLRFLGSLIEELGAKMYPSITASVAELISNAWDADAENVWITMPLGRRTNTDGSDEIVVLDDGIGMSREDARQKYLVIGRKRRTAEGSWTSPSGRPLHGRKGVGKLAAFGTAKLLTCTTWTNTGECTAFQLDYDQIRSLDVGEDHKVKEVSCENLPQAPGTNETLMQGTRISLSRLLSKVIPTETQFRASLARRFGVLSPEMKVFLNGEQIERFNIPVDIRFPRDGIPMPGNGLPRTVPQTGETPMPIEIDGEWAVESLPEGEIRWWIGFTPTPIQAADLRGISVLSHRKMVQRPFMFGRSQGTAGQLGQEYLVGEVVADWLDDNLRPEDDLVETNRNELQLEDDRLGSFLEWGRSRLRWALELRSRLRMEKTEEKAFLDNEVKARLEKFTSKEQGLFKGIGNKLSAFPEANASDVTGSLLEIMDSYDDKLVREMIERISEESEPTQDRMWALVAEFGLIDARRTATKVQARMQVIQKLEEMVEGGAPEVPDIHNHIRDNPWLLDPRWDLYDDEVNLTKMLHEKYGTVVEGKGNIADYVFALGPSAPTSADEVIVVEIKRGRNADGTLRHADHTEVTKFGGYVEDAKAFYGRANSPSELPTVKGLMIASGYTPQADSQRRALQSVPGGIYQFKSWDSVLKDTKRLHLWWLDVSTRRGNAAL